MPIYQKLVNYNQLFSRLKIEPIILNNVDIKNESSRDFISNLLMTKYNSDMSSLIPSCLCGEIKGEFSIGLKCNNCNSVVKSSLEEDIEPIFWLSRPKDKNNNVIVSKLINPKVWYMASRCFSKSGFNFLNWIADPRYKSDIDKEKLADILSLISDNIPVRGYNYFVNSFYQILRILSQFKFFKSNYKKIMLLFRFLEEYQDCIFSDYLPVPNKSLFILQYTNLGVYVDETTLKGINAVNTFLGIDTENNNYSQSIKERRTIVTINKLAEFYSQHERKIQSPKPGWFRKHIFGTRAHFSFRTVISSITEPHNYDENYIPWSVGVTLFRPYLINKLLKVYPNYNLNDVLGILNTSVEEYNPVIDKIFKELIDESKEKRIPNLADRNPSLSNGSLQELWIPKVKTNVKDKTSSVSILICQPFNLDKSNICPPS